MSIVALIIQKKASFQINQTVVPVLGFIGLPFGDENKELM